MVIVACKSPANGPESNSAVIVMFPAGCVWGTRTEARQNVPHEKPEWAVATVSLSVFTRAIRAPRSSWVEGDTGAPQ